MKGHKFWSRSSASVFPEKHSIHTFTCMLVHACACSCSLARSPVRMHADASLHSLTRLPQAHLLIHTDSCSVSHPCSQAHTHAHLVTELHRLALTCPSPHLLRFFLLEQLIIRSSAIYFVFSTTSSANGTDYYFVCNYR